MKAKHHQLRDCDCVLLYRSLVRRMRYLRYMKYDFKENGFTDNNALNGPFVQAGVNF
jgi:hypothetical protein